jgi:hypothetical protein
VIYTHAAAAIIAASLAGWAGWSVQGWRLGEQIAALKTAQAEAVNTATREARATESRRFTNVQEAQNAAQKRAQTARLDADRARTELDRLRDELASTRGGVPGESPAACAEPSSQRDNVLLECLSSYEALGRDADLWKNDALMLRDAWPK